MKKTGKLKIYKASLKLKENVTPLIMIIIKLSVHLLPLVVTKLQRLIEQDLLEHVPPGGRKWASPTVVLRKSDGDIRICGDNKIGVNHKVFFVEVPIHALVGVNFFTKIDLKTAYYQIPIDDNFKEVTTINSPIGLLKWRRMPYGIKIASTIFQRAIEQVLRKDIKIWFVIKTIYA